LGEKKRIFFVFLKKKFTLSNIRKKREKKEKKKEEKTKFILWKEKFLLELKSKQS
jgi:hypothetical protein